MSSSSGRRMARPCSTSSATRTISRVRRASGTWCCSPETLLMSSRSEQEVPMWGFNKQTAALPVLALMVLSTGFLCAQALQAPAETPVTPPPVGPADYLAPLSHLHLGPLNFYSVDLQGAMSNQPVGTNLSDAVLGAGTPERKSFLGRGSL